MSYENWGNQWRGSKRRGLLGRVSVSLAWTSVPHCWCKISVQQVQVHQETRDPGGRHTACRPPLCVLILRRCPLASGSRCYFHQSLKYHEPQKRKATQSRSNISSQSWTMDCHSTHSDTFLIPCSSGRPHWKAVQFLFLWWHRTVLGLASFAIPFWRELAHALK